MKKFLIRLIQKYLLEKSKIQPGDLIEHIDDPNFTVESLGIYYSYDLKPFIFFRTNDGYISSRPVYEFKRCTNVDKILEGYI